MRLSVTRPATTTLEINEEEMKEVAIKYIEDIVMNDCYINKKGRLEWWTSFPHGSGTYEDRGVPSPLQKKAWDFLGALKEAKK